LKLFGQDISRNNVRNQTYTLIDESFLDALGVESVNTDKLGEINYFICFNYLVQAMSKMPRYLYQTIPKKGVELVDNPQLTYLLNVEPNPYYNASTLWGTVEANRLHYGNAYVYKEYDKAKGKLKHLWIIPSNETTIYIDDDGIFQKEKGGIWYVWIDSRSGKQHTFSKDELLHFRTHITFDGLAGIPIKDILKTKIQTLLYSEQYQNNLFKNNLFGGKILLQHTSDLNKEAKDKLIVNTERYVNSVGSGKFIPLPSNITAQPLNLSSNEQAQFAELNSLSSLQIAGAFLLPPNVINDYSKSSYANSESQQLSIYTNALQPIFNMYNQESTIKLLLYSQRVDKQMKIEIYKDALFELDKKTQAEIYSKYVNNFMATPAEARERIGFPYREGTDQFIGNGNFITLDSIKNNGKGGNGDE
jgi:HK97 family phage portal protein